MPVDAVKSLRRKDKDLFLVRRFLGIQVASFLFIQQGSGREEQVFWNIVLVPGIMY